MKQSLEISQKQKQRFSTKLVPSMEILSLSWEELESLVDASLVDNPFSDVEQNSMIFDDNEMEWDYKKNRKLQDDFQEYECPDDNNNDLTEHVMRQLYPYIHSKKDEEIFTMLLECLDSRGFLMETKEDLCRFLNITKTKLTRYLNVLNHIDPKGLGATDVKECICIQLSEMENSILAQKIVNEYLEDISAGKFTKIAKLENTSVEEIRKVFDVIRSLNPIPANGYRVKERTVFITPDVYIQKDEAGFTLEMNSKIQDRLRINEENYNLYKTSNYNEDAKTFLKQKLNDFRLLQYSISRRNITLKKIVTFLLEHQLEFFRTGNEKYLKPLRLVDIAQELHMHPSTICRAISNKYFQCEYGTYPFQFLIPRCYEKQGEITVSIETIKNEIIEIVRTEDKEKPYSDEKIHLLLEEEGYIVSRRSVTLYRKECGIPTSRNRKITVL